MKFQILKKEDNFIINNDIIAEKVIIATGGATFPKTGSTGDGYYLTDNPVTDIKYGLVPLITKKRPVRHCRNYII